LRNLVPYGLAAIAIAILTATPTTALPLLEIVNGDFSNGADHWTVTGSATIAGGVATMGDPVDADCFGPEGNGVLGSITYQDPTLNTFTTVIRVEYDYTVRTLDVAAFDGIAIYFVDVLGNAYRVDAFNPNPAYGDCVTLSGHHAATLSLPPPFPAWFLDLVGQKIPSVAATVGYIRIGAYGDAFGDPFIATIDNVVISTIAGPLPA
jgi:hypothetical protein